MAVFNMIEEADATGKVKEVFEDIKKKRNTDYINNFWKMLANNPRNFRENLEFYTASDEKRCFR